MASKTKVKCSFKDCFEFFSSLKEMKQHKKYSQQHDYCHICDLDFDDWSTAVAHKSQMSGMDGFRKTQKEYKKEKGQGGFWANKERFGPTYGELKFHMYHCKFCGEKFNTESARQRHTLQLHPIDQDIQCLGCEQTFPRAAGLMYHLEEGYCRSISSVEFKGYLQHKGLINRLLQDPYLLEEISNKDIFGYLESARDDSKTGGVSLLDIDEDDITWDEDEDILQPEKPVVSFVMPREQQTFPSLPPHMRIAGKSDLATAMAGLDLDSTKKAGSGWHAASPSKALFPAAKPTPATNEWQERSKALQQEGHKSNILTFQFWNPAHPDYNPDRFYDPIIEKHRCPFPECEQWFDAHVDCQTHIAEQHAITKIRCPSCLKLFGRHHALIAHVETSEKCNLKHSDKFGQALDEFSGGFLSHKVVAHPDLKAEEDGYEVGYIKYESAVPAGWEERDETTVVGTKL